MNKWHRGYENGEGRVEQHGPSSYIGSFTPYAPSIGNAPLAERPNLDDAKAAVDAFAGHPKTTWAADTQNS